MIQFLSGLLSGIGKAASIVGSGVSSGLSSMGKFGGEVAGQGINAADPSWLKFMKGYQNVTNFSPAKYVIGKVAPSLQTDQGQPAPAPASVPTLRIGGGGGEPTQSTPQQLPQSSPAPKPPMSVGQDLSSVSDDELDILRDAYPSNIWVNREITRRESLRQKK